MDCMDLQKFWISRILQIQWEILYIECIDFQDLQKIWISKWRKLDEKLCTLDVQINRICRKFEFYRYNEYTEFSKFNRKFCTLDV